MKNINLNNLFAIVFISFMVVFPLGSNSSWLAIATTFLIYTCVAFSQDIVLGRAGVFHMGHAVFFGIGAYTTAILNIQFGWPIIATFLPAIIFPALIALVLAGGIIHLKGDYLLVATIGFNVIFIQILQNDIFGLTGGPNGIFGIEFVKIFNFELSSQINMYYLTLFLLILTLIIIKNLDKSKIGRALFYINKDEIAAQSLGINIRYYKLFAFMLASAIAGIAGSLFAIQYSAVSPEAFDFMQSVMFFAIVLVGGSASVPGVVLGTFIMFILPEIFREFEEARYLIFGIAMILTMILRPKGICPRKFGEIPKYLYGKNK